MHPSSVHVVATTATDQRETIALCLGFRTTNLDKWRPKLLAEYGIRISHHWETIKSRNLPGDLDYVFVSTGYNGHSNRPRNLGTTTAQIIHLPSQWIGIQQALQTNGVEMLQQPDNQQAVRLIEAGDDHHSLPEGQHLAISLKSCIDVEEAAFIAIATAPWQHNNDIRERLENSGFPWTTTLIHTFTKIRRNLGIVPRKKSTHKNMWLCVPMWKTAFEVDSEIHEAILDMCKNISHPIVNIIHTEEEYWTKLGKMFGRESNSAPKKKKTPPVKPAVKPAVKSAVKHPDQTPEESFREALEILKDCMPNGTQSLLITKGENGRWNVKLKKEVVIVQHIEEDLTF